MSKTSKLIDLLGLNEFGKNVRDWVNAHFQRKVDGKGLSTYDYDKTAKDKVDAIPADPKYTDTTYEAGDGISIEDNVISATGGGGGGGEENVIESISVNGTAQTVTNKNVDIAVPTKTSDLNNDSGFITGFTETDPTVPSWAKQSNKPSYDYSEIGNTPTIPVVPTNVSAFNNDAGYLTQHQDISNYIQKSQTAGLIKNDGTVDTTQYGTYSKPSTGIPASDLASGVIPTVPVQDVTVGGTSVVNNGTAEIPAIPDISGKADKVLVATTEPSGGMLPNVLYEFGELSGNTTFTLATPSDNTIANHYYWTFDTPSTAPTITWPTGLTWFGGSAPTISASKHYEISVLNGIAVAMEV